ncbi:MAG: acetyl-CoA carboxylase biotin carboxyl carrier protein [Saprospiraceae bacterium]|jgi:acetyl-CoA carboxylase biotin carboxyl carrier protein|tara:strand:+ start:2469 stop:2957 length:489 start_codon:yes stop_codon:yes gene_type:complete
MNYKEITDLIKLVNKTDLAEVKLKDNDFEISIRTSNFQGKSTQVVQSSSAPMMQMPAAAPAAPTATPPGNATKSEPAAESTEGLLEVKSPIVGTFYRSASPDKPVYAKVGDSIEKGDTVCIVEAMKLFNEIESEVSGTIVKVMVEDAAPVEYDQVLFLVDPS